MRKVWCCVGVSWLGCMLLSKVNARCTRLGFALWRACRRGAETLGGRGLWRYHTSIFIPIYAYLEGVVVNLSVRKDLFQCRLTVAIPIPGSATTCACVISLAFRRCTDAVVSVASGCPSFLPSALARVRPGREQPQRERSVPGCGWRSCLLSLNH